jgi:phosphoribosyl 1,2-cyclic phosphodiesterase
MVRLDHHGVAVPPVVNVLFTRYHWDHIQGLSMFRSLWQGEQEFCYRGPNDPQGALTGAVRPPWFPVALDGTACVTSYRSPGGPFQMGEAAVTAFPANHPQGAFSYRYDSSTGGLALVTDHDNTSDSDRVIAASIKGVDVLFHDAQYSPKGYDSHGGWCRSISEHATAMAERIGSGRLVLTSLGSERTDDEIDFPGAEAKERFDGTRAASEGLRVGF